jgi:hypothetical protein
VSFSPKDAIFVEVAGQVARTISRGMPEDRHLLAVATQRVVDDGDIVWASGRASPSLVFDYESPARWHGPRARSRRPGSGRRNYRVLIAEQARHTFAGIGDLSATSVGRPVLDGKLAKRISAALRAERNLAFLHWREPF